MYCSLCPVFNKNPCKSTDYSLYDKIWFLKIYYVLLHVNITKTATIDEKNNLVPRITGGMRRHECIAGEAKGHRDTAYGH